MKHFVVVMLINVIACSENKKEVDLSTDYFEFKNSYWINLHHFLYQKADSSQLRNLREDNLKFIEVGEDDIFAKLSQTEEEVLNQAVRYYKVTLTDKSLRRDLSNLRNWFQHQEKLKVLTDTTYGKKFIEVINRVSPVYDRYFWEIHKAHNLSVLAMHIKTIDEIEEEVLSKMERFSLNKWPDSSKVRVDITAYANWAGGYTASKPEMNVVISTLDPTNLTSSFIETILHEGSHLLYLFGESPVRDKIYYKSEELGMEFPRNLWHASMFYLSGRATQEALSKQDMNHKLLIDEKNIFRNYLTPKLRTINEKYYRNNLNMDSMVVKLLTEIKKSH